MYEDDTGRLMLLFLLLLFPIACNPACERDADPTALFP